MKNRRIKSMFIALGLSVMAAQSYAGLQVQCPGDLNGDAIPDQYILNKNGQPTGKVNPAYNPSIKCMHLAAGDGFITMADGKTQYIFGFSDLTGVKDLNGNGITDEAMEAGMLAANFTAPTIAVNEGEQLYLTLSNVGMIMRPDLFDPHSVHWHGFANAAPIFDGVPESSITINMGASLTYYYNVLDPGTYMYHCHVEATEHMQMGMLGNLFVRPKQDKLPAGTPLPANGFIHQAGYKYAFNDGDGTTRYDVDYPLQLGSMDPNFHDLHAAVQPLPFALMKDRYFMINGRGYPDTINPNAITTTDDNGVTRASQKVSSLITATQGQKILLRLSNLNVTRQYTVATTGLPMKIVGKDARLLRSAAGQNLYYDTSSITLTSGETADAIIDTTGVAPGTYFLYTTNLHLLSNDAEDFGGMMTEIVIN